MSDFDQTARALVDLEPHLFLAWLATRAGLTLAFRAFYSERTAPRPGSPERIADQVAILDDPSAPQRPWLFLLEWQTTPDEKKLDILLEEASILRSRVFWGAERDRPYLVLPILLHLTGSAAEPARDMRTPLGFGDYRKPLPWDIASDDASAVLDQIEQDRLPWVLLFWLPLMQRGGEEIIITRWRAVAETKAPSHRQGDLREAALTFAELAGTYLAWERILRSPDMGESQYLNGVRERSRIQGELRTRRADLLELLAIKFPGQAPPEVVQLIEYQESMDLLRDWFRAGLRATTYDEFLAVLRQ